MISRADAVISSNIELVSTSNDALKFFAGPTKTDQEGKAHVDHPFHIYACPENPAICPVLALTKHLLLRPQLLKGNCKLFEGSNQYAHYSDILRSIVQSREHRQSLIDRGMNPNFYGTHSMRKGAVTFIASGITSAPPIASICIRANWKMPGVTNRYIKYEDAGDQYVGRCVSGRSRMGRRFAESNAYFDFSDYSWVEKERMLREQDAWIKARMPEAGAVNDAVFCMFRACLASFLHHFDWLNETLHSQNALRCSPFWAEKADFPHSNCVTTRFPWNATKDTPQFTGIPIDIIYLKKIEELLLHIERLEAKIEEGNNRVIDQISNHVDKSLDDRMVGGESYGMSRAVIDKLDLVIQQIGEANRERVEAVAAAVGVDIEGSNANGSAGGFDEDELIEFTVQQEQVQVLQKQAVDEAAKSRAAEQLTRRLNSGFTVGLVDGHWNPLPPGWKYPTKMNMQQMITLWLMGNPTERVPPLRTVSPKHVSTFDRKSKNLNRMKNCMLFIKRVAVRKGVWSPNNAVAYWNGDTVSRLWDGVSGTILPILKTKTTRKDGTISYHKSRSMVNAWRTNADKLIKYGRTGTA